MHNNDIDEDKNKHFDYYNSRESDSYKEIEYKDIIKEDTHLRKISEGRTTEEFAEEIEKEAERHTSLYYSWSWE